MIAKLVDRKKSIDLRSKGYSISEISKLIGVAKSSVWKWTKGIVLDQKAKDRIYYLRQKGYLRAKETVHNKAVGRVRKAKLWAEQVIKSKSLDRFEYQLICSILYWGEGGKHVNRVEFTNSDPLMVKVFLESLEKGFGVDRKVIKANLHLHSYHDEVKQIQMWSKLLNINEGQFNKTYWKKHGEKIKREDYQGCIRLCCNSKEIVDKIKSFYFELSKNVIGP